MVWDLTHTMGREKSNWDLLYDMFRREEIQYVVTIESVRTRAGHCDDLEFILHQ